MNSPAAFLLSGVALVVVANRIRTQGIASESWKR